MRAARRAGRIAASTPTTIETTRNTTSCTPGHGELDAHAAEARRHHVGEDDADDDAEHAADHRGDHALVAHAAPDLAPRGADGAQQTDLARALVHAQHQRVDDAEERDDHAHGQQPVEQVQQLVELPDDAVLVLRRRHHVRRRQVGHARPRSPPWSASDSPPAVARTMKSCGRGKSVLKAAVLTVIPLSIIGSR